MISRAGYTGSGNTEAPSVQGNRKGQAKMNRIEVETSVSMDAYDVTHSGLTRDEIMHFILDIDEEMCDTSFTNELIEKLKEAL